MAKKKRKRRSNNDMRWQWIVLAGALLFFVVLQLVVIANLFIENRKLKAELKSQKKVAEYKPVAPPKKKVTKKPRKKHIAKTTKAKKAVKKSIKKSLPKMAAPKKRVREKARPMLAIILDDWGYTNKNFHYLDEIKECMDISIFPNHQYTKEAAVYAHSRGKEVMLHLPMQPKNLSPEHWEADTITTDMDWARIRDITESAVLSVPYVRGANNHMGSKATESPYVMQAVLSLFKEKGLFWVDSVSTAESVAGQVAKNQGVRFAKRDVFIDNESDIAYIKEQIKKAVALALSRGSAIAIGHDRPNTLQAIKEMIPEIKKQGVRIVCVSKLVK